MISRCIRGVTDLATTHPEIAAEWNDEKNRPLTPDQVMAGSGKRVWWECKFGHEWKTAVYHRKAGHGCPKCKSREAQVKKGENDLLTLRPELAEQWDYELNHPLKPDEVTIYSQMKVWWRCKEGHTWKTTVGKRTSGQKCPVCSGHTVKKGFNDLTTTHPELAAEWNHEKNKDLRPEDVMAGSDKSVWWLCGEGHEWKALIYGRKAGNGCPYCARNTVLPGENDLATVAPKVAKSWDYNRNGALQPEYIAAKSNRKVWWLCDRGHSWEAPVASRTEGKGCPYCKSRLVLPGFNDLATRRVQLCNEWDYEKNGDLTPEMVTEFSKVEVWWRCKEGHEWKAQIANRSNGTNCPVCSNRQVLKGFNDLETVDPELSAQWYRFRNVDLTPDKVTPFSNRKVWWQCDNGHYWRASISGRSEGHDCPYCRNKKAWPGYNDLASHYPEIAKEWDSDLNGTIRPDQVVLGSKTLYWWMCGRGHNFQKSAYDRVHRNENCPYCNNRAVYPGFNDLATVSPWLVEDWDFERNGDLRPEMIMPYSNRKVWWKCSCGYRWKSAVGSRQLGIGCPRCSGRITYRRHLVP